MMPAPTSPPLRLLLLLLAAAAAAAAGAASQQQQPQPLRPSSGAFPSGRTYDEAGAAFGAVPAAAAAADRTRAAARSNASSSSVVPAFTLHHAVVASASSGEGGVLRVALVVPWRLDDHNSPGGSSLPAWLGLGVAEPSSGSMAGADMAVVRLPLLGSPGAAGTAHPAALAAVVAAGGVAVEDRWAPAPKGTPPVRDQCGAHPGDDPGDQWRLVAADLALAVNDDAAGSGGEDVAAVVVELERPLHVPAAVWLAGFGPSGSATASNSTTAATTVPAVGTPGSAVSHEDRPVPPGRVRIVWGVGPDAVGTPASGSSTPELAPFSGHAADPAARGAGSIVFYTNHSLFGPAAEQAEEGAPALQPFAERVEGYDSILVSASDKPIATVDTEYYNVYLDVPSEFTNVIDLVAFDAVIDPRAVDYVHHFVLYGCRNVSSNRCSRVLWGWAPGSDGLALPNVTGFHAQAAPVPFGSDTFHQFKLNIHYNNPRLDSGILDSSGVRIYHAGANTTLRPYRAVTFQVGDGLLMQKRPIPAGPETQLTHYEYDCPSMCTNFWNEPKHVVSVMLHMHEVGRQIWLTRTRNNVTKDILRIDHWDFHFQNNIQVDEWIEPGDRLNLHCVYHSTPGRDVPFADRSQDEMCLAWLVLYPAPAEAECLYLELVPGSNLTGCNGVPHFGVTNPSVVDPPGGAEVKFGQCDVTPGPPSPPSSVAGAAAGVPHPPAEATSAPPHDFDEFALTTVLVTLLVVACFVVAGAALWWQGTAAKRKADRAGGDNIGLAVGGTSTSDTTDEESLSSSSDLSTSTSESSDSSDTYE